MHREARYYCVNTGANELHGTEYEETAPKLWGQTRTEALGYAARHVFNTCFVSVMLGDQIKKLKPDSMTFWLMLLCTQTQISGHPGGTATVSQNSVQTVAFVRLQMLLSSH